MKLPTGLSLNFKNSASTQSLYVIKADLNRNVLWVFKSEGPGSIGVSGRATRYPQGMRSAWLSRE